MQKVLIKQLEYLLFTLDQNLYKNKTMLISDIFNVNQGIVSGLDKAFV